MKRLADCTRFCIALGFFYLSFIPLCLSLVFIDITPFHFKADSTKGLRILVFNVSEQFLEKAIYIQMVNQRALHKIAYTHPLFHVNFKGQIAHKAAQTNDTIIHSFAEEEKMLPTLLDNQTSALKALQNTLQKTAHPKKSLVIIWKKGVQEETRSLETISFHPATNRKERGFLGERVTEILFLLLGFKQIHGQNASNQGLDGIFLDKEKTSLILTESKCRQESKTAAKYMVDDLNEQKIASRLSEIKNTQLRTWLKEYIQNHLSNVYKLVQRLKPSGVIESNLAPLDSLLYIKETFPNLSKAPYALRKKFLELTFKALDIEPRLVHFLVRPPS